MKIVLPPVYDYQHRALFGPERYAVVEGCTKAGKTFPALLWLLAEAGEVAQRLGEGRRNFWWVAPTIEQASMVYNRLLDMLRRADQSGIGWDHQDQSKTITIDDLGVFRFKTGEVPDNLFGDDVYGAVMDEFTRQREESWHAVRSTLTFTGGRIRLIGNVKGRKNWGYRLARMAESGSKGMSYAKFTCADAVRVGLMPQSEVDDARTKLPDAVFRELYMAEPSDDEGNPFGIEHIRACVAPMSDREPSVFGIDLAKTRDWTVVIGLDDSGTVCRFDRFHGASWDSIEGRILACIGDVPTIVDSTGVGDPIVERLARERPNVTGYPFTSKSKQYLMDGLAMAVQGRSIRFPAGPIQSEMETFEYNYTRSGVTYSAPEPLHDDCVCALALAASGYTSMAGFHAPSVEFVGMPRVSRGWKVA